MITYKNYCNRRTDRKGQEPNDIPCCPSRMPIIGPILFSLFIFSPYFLSSSNSEKSPNAVIDESLPPYEHIQQEREVKGEDLQNLQSRYVENLGEKKSAPLVVEKAGKVL